MDVEDKAEWSSVSALFYGCYKNPQTVPTSASPPHTLFMSLCHNKKKKITSKGELNCDGVKPQRSGGEWLGQRRSWCRCRAFGARQPMISDKFPLVTDQRELTTAISLVVVIRCWIWIDAFKKMNRWVDIMKTQNVNVSLLSDDIILLHNLSFGFVMYMISPCWGGVVWRQTFVLSAASSAKVTPQHLGCGLEDSWLFLTTVPRAFAEMFSRTVAHLPY